MSLETTFKHTALITGASSGIGEAFAHLHASKGRDLVLVARNIEALKALKSRLEQEHHVKVFIIAQDLARHRAAEKIFEQTQAQNIFVEILINNAGCGGHGKFYQRALSAEQSMMQLNMLALTELCHYYLPAMVAANRGHILNVSSIVSFMPGPLQAVYYASKAYVTSFSQALSEELRGSGVSVTALCPGAVNTGFVAASDLQGVAAWDNAASAESVALCGYKAMEKGQLLAFNQRSLKFLVSWITPFLPRKMLLRISRHSMEKR